MNDTDTDTDEILKDQEAINLFIKGRDAWNEWAEQHEGWVVDFSGLTFPLHGNPSSVSFESYVFLGPVKFEDTYFRCNKVSFESSIFKDGDVSFYGAKFDGSKVYFDKAVFSNGNKDFRMDSSSSFKLISFYGTEFGDGDLEFSDLTSNESITFNHARIGKGSHSFENITVTNGSLNFYFAKVKIDLSKSINFTNINIQHGDVDLCGFKFIGGDINFYFLRVQEGKVLIKDVKEFNAESLSFSNLNIENGELSLYDSEFEKCSINFDNANIGSDFLLTGAKFNHSDNITFNGLKVGRSLILDNTYFSVVPDFRNILVERDVSMIDMKVKYMRKIRFVGRSSNREHGDMYQKLKSLAIKANDHQRELEFFAMEEKAKFMWHRNPIEYFPTFLYGLLSNFGRSLWRPMIGLLATGCSAVACFQYILSGTWSIQGLKVWFLSLLYLLPFVPGSRDTRKNLICTFYRGESNDSINACVELIERVAFAESFFALLFLFLIGLALRNRFRL